ncbi:MAG: hypothetical protein UZ17_ACD001000673, partial [Acidobacteria bacterium OLB17]
AGIEKAETLPLLYELPDNGLDQLALARSRRADPVSMSFQVRAADIKRLAPLTPTITDL